MRTFHKKSKIKNGFYFKFWILLFRSEGVRACADVTKKYSNLKFCSLEVEHALIYTFDNKSKIAFIQWILYEIWISNI